MAKPGDMVCVSAKWRNWAVKLLAERCLADAQLIKESVEAYLANDAIGIALSVNDDGYMCISWIGVPTNNIYVGLPWHTEHLEVIT